MTETDVNLEAKLDAIISGIAEIKSFHAAQEVRLAAVECQNTKNREAIDGNGKPGLKTEMAIMKDGMNRINWVSGALLLFLLGDMVSRVMALVSK